MLLVSALLAPAPSRQASALSLLWTHESPVAEPRARVHPDQAGSPETEATCPLPMCGGGGPQKHAERLLLGLAEGARRMPPTSAFLHKSSPISGLATTLGPPCNHGLPDKTHCPPHPSQRGVSRQKSLFSRWWQVMHSKKIC